MPRTVSRRVSDYDEVAGAEVDRRTGTRGVRRGREGNSPGGIHHRHHRAQAERTLPQRIGAAAPEHLRQYRGRNLPIASRRHIREGESRAGAALRFSLARGDDGGTHGYRTAALYECGPAKPISLAARAAGPRLEFRVGG